MEHEEEFVAALRLHLDGEHASAWDLWQGALALAALAYVPLSHAYARRCLEEAQRQRLVALADDARAFLLTGWRRTAPQA